MNLPAIPNTMDPFSQSYELLRRMLLNAVPLAAMFADHNLLLSTDPTQQLNQERASEWMLKKTGAQGEGDLPELRVVPTSITPMVGRDSDHSSFTMKFDFQVSTGKFETADPRGLFPVQLAIAVAWSSWQPMFGQLLWLPPGATPPARAFIHKAMAVEAVQKVEADEANRIRGWATVWSVVVEPWLATKDLQSLTTLQGW